MRTPIGELKNLEGPGVELSGWVHARRDHRKITFIDLRDRSGLVQVVFTPGIPEAANLRLEYVISVKGLVKKRPASMANALLPNGLVEVEAKEMQILNKSEAPAISVDT